METKMELVERLWGVSFQKMKLPEETVVISFALNAGYLPKKEGRAWFLKVLDPILTNQRSFHYPLGKNE